MNFVKNLFKKKPIFESVGKAEYTGWDLNDKDIKDSCEWISGFIKRELDDAYLEQTEKSLMLKGISDGLYFTYVYSCIAAFQDLMNSRPLSQKVDKSIQLWVIAILKYIKNEGGGYPKIGGSGIDIWTRRANAHSKIGEYSQAITILSKGLDIYIHHDKWELGKLSTMDVKFNSDPSKPEVMMANLCKYLFEDGQYENSIKMGKKVLESIGIRGHEDYQVKNFPKGIKYFVDESEKVLKKYELKFDKSNETEVDNVKLKDDKIFELIDGSLLNDNKQDISEIMIISNIEKLFYDNKNRQIQFHLWKTKDNYLNKIFIYTEEDLSKDIIDVAINFKTKLNNIICKEKSDVGISNRPFIAQLVQYIEPFYVFLLVDENKEYDGQIFLLKDIIFYDMIAGFMKQWPKHSEFFLLNPLLEKKDFEKISYTKDIRYQYSPTSNVGVNII